MRPAPFAYARPADLSEAVELLAAAGSDARVLAGGQSLLELMNRRQAAPRMLVDIKRIPGLRYLTLDGGALRVGALSTHRDIEEAADDDLLAAFGVLPRTAPWIGHHPIRTRGTLAGSLANADPRAEWVVLAVLLDARITLQCAAGSRTVRAADFFRGPQCTAARPDELIVEVSFPRPAPGAALAEFSYRRGDLPIVLVASDVGLDEDCRVERVRIVVGGVAERPLRATAAEAHLLGRPATQDAIADAAGLVAIGFEAQSDEIASASYRKQLSAELATRALSESLQRLRASHPGTYRNHGGTP